MLDLLLGAGLVAAIVHGYRRGLLRGVVVVVVVVAGVLVGYRAGPAGVGMVSSWTGAGPGTARIIGSAVVCVAILAVGSVLARRFPVGSGPLGWLDRVAGAALSAASFAVVAVLLILLPAALPSVPDRVDELVADSRVAEAIKSRSELVTPTISRILGDRIIESSLNINRLIGTSRLVIGGEERVDLPPVTSSLVDRPTSAGELFERLNLTRIEEGVRTVAWSAALADVAGGHGREMYEHGFFSHVSPATGSVYERVEAVGIPFRVVGENLALSHTVDSVHEGLLASDSHRATMLDQRFTRVGVSVLEGPLGLMVVQVFTG